MAIQNDPRLYTGGGERFDSRPHVALYANILARRQAKHDAFDEYIRGLNKGINSVGLRNQDRPAFEEKLKKWQEYGMENRDRLRDPRKDGGKASLEFQVGYQDLMNHIAESKQEEEKKKPLVEIMIDPNKRDRLSEDLIPEIEAHDQPLYIPDANGNLVRNPNRKSFDVSKISFDPKPIDYGKFWSDNFGDIKKSETTVRGATDKKTMTRIDTTTAAYKPEDLDLIATKAVSLYGTSPSFKKDVDGLNPVDYNDAFKQAFGTDIQDKGDLAAAFALSNLQKAVTTEKPADDAFAIQKFMEGLRQSNRLKLLEKREEAKAKGAAANDLWIDEYVSRLVEEAKQGQKTLYENTPGVSYEIPLDPVMAKAFIKDKLTPDKLLITESGKFVPIYYKYKDGEIQKIESGVNKGTPLIDKIASIPISEEQVKLALGKTSAGVKQLNKEMTSPKQPAKQKTYKGLDKNGNPIFE